MVDYDRIKNTLDKMDYYLQTYNNICVSISGGSDSNIILHIIATYFRQYLNKIHFVFENTGLEYRATLNHIKFMKERYNINIETVKGTPIPIAVKNNGMPVISKKFSSTCKYGAKGSEWAIERMTLPHKEYAFALTPKQQNLAWFLVNKNIPVSSMCCDLSKKKPIHKYFKDNNIDLNITGERKAEGGQRAKQNSCFSSGKSGPAKYMPLFFWDDDTKEWYKENEDVVYSDCYEVWGMKRTGCVGCPFNSKMNEDLRSIKKYEPNMYKACMNIFGLSYYLMDKFGVRKNIILDEEETKMIQDKYKELLKEV